MARVVGMMIHVVLSCPGRGKNYDLDVVVLSCHHVTFIRFIVLERNKLSDDQVIYP